MRQKRHSSMGSILVGAGLMYLLDPDRGARRRGLLRDQAIHARRRLGDGLGTTFRDLRNRVRGAAAKVQSRVRADEVDDDVIEERVRSTLGRVVSHPGAIEVAVSNGVVTLGGAVLQAELDRLVDAVRDVRGVERVVTEHLRTYPTANGVPDLQGGRHRERRSEWRQTNWSPTLRLAAGVLGVAAVVQGLRGRRRSPLAGVLGTVGLGVLARALTNLPVRRMVGVGAGRRAVDIQKVIEVDAPIDRVWALWSNFENFPRFMSHLREVRKTDGGRSHWVAHGPGRIPVEWDAVTTEWIPNEVMAWKSVEGSPIRTAGIVRFEPISDHATRVNIRLSYNPPAGVIGQAVASLFRADPKHALDDDLLRLKSLLEEGKTTADGHRVKLDELPLQSP